MHIANAIKTAGASGGQFGEILCRRQKNNPQKSAITKLHRPLVGDHLMITFNKQSERRISLLPTRIRANNMPDGMKHG
jgi:hypothetical protein